MSTVDKSRARILYVEPGTRKLRNTRSLEDYLKLRSNRQRPRALAVRAGWRMRLKRWWKSSSRDYKLQMIIAAAGIVSVLIAAATLAFILP